VTARQSGAVPAGWHQQLSYRSQNNYRRARVPQSTVCTYDTRGWNVLLAPNSIWGSNKFLLPAAMSLTAAVPQR
jgi:hypothetical protein